VDDEMDRKEETCRLYEKEEILPIKSYGRREKNRPGITEPIVVISKKDYFNGQECGMCTPVALCPVSSIHIAISYSGQLIVKHNGSFIPLINNNRVNPE
jgi:hypothetical protein